MSKLKQPRTRAGHAFQTRLKGGAPLLAANPALGWFVFPFFGLHMFMFGLSGFLLAYASTRAQVGFLYMHGGIAIAVYLVFYRLFFGTEQVKWMLINGALGVLGIYSQVGWVLRRFGRDIGDYPWYVHLVPFTYYVLYTFLLWQLVLAVSGAARDPVRRRRVETGYVVVSVLVYGLLLWRTR